MNERSPSVVFERRELLLGAAAAGTLLTILGLPAGAQQAPPPAGAAPQLPPQQVTWQEAMRAVIGDAVPVEGRIKLELPDTAENGNVVPFTVTVESAMTAADHVKAVHLFSTANPKPDIASAYFTLASGKAVFSSRLRLGRSQDVITIAEMSDGKIHIGKRNIKVTIGGCGTG